MLIKCAKSLSELRPAPSAMFDGIETAARVIWDTKLNFSSIGKDAVNLYISSTRSIACCQICRLL